MFAPTENAAPSQEQIEAYKKLKARARPYSGRHRYEDDDTPAPTPTPEPVGQTPTSEEGRDNEDEVLSPEEITYKKRYGDLRTLHQNDKREFDRTISTLQARVEQLETAGPATMPKSEQEVKAWMSEYPDLAATILHLTDTKIKERLSTVQTRLDTVEEQSLDVAREKAYLKLLKIHSDADEIRQSEDFHNWVKDQPDAIQDWFYGNDDDYRLAARGIDMFKADTGWGKPKKKDKKDARDLSREVPESVKPAGQDLLNPQQRKRVFKASEIAKMNPREFESLEAEIDEAQMEGRIINDLQNSRAN